MKKIRSFFWWLSWSVKVIPTCDQAREMGLIFYRNVYGDEINKTNCRSFWLDQYNRPFRCAELNRKEWPACVK